MRNLIFAGAVLAIAAPTFAGPDVTPDGIATIGIGGGLSNPADVLYDNGDLDYVNGYSAAHEDVFGSRRSLLEDFTSAGWDVGGASTLFIWNSGATMQGTNMEVAFYANDGTCTPSTTAFAVANITSFTETVRGDLGQLFSRDIVQLDVTFDTINLPAGDYWIDLLPVGPENGFIATAPLNGCECWVDYADFGGRAPGQTIFGATSDIVFSISGAGGAGDCLDLTVDNLIANETAIFTLTGGTDGELGAVVYSFNLGSMSGTFGTWCYDFGLSGLSLNSVVIQGVFSGGMLQAGKFIPGPALGMTVHFQGLESGTCPDPCMSNIVTGVVQ